MDPEDDETGAWVGSLGSSTNVDYYMISVPTNACILGNQEVASLLSNYYT